MSNRKCAKLQLIHKCNLSHVLVLEFQLRAFAMPFKGKCLIAYTLYVGCRTIT
ncbi:hypothetical protein BRADI_4g42112v3 [Brachypodium distachyon]|uniref:Uncharacterized protein n=1 Tax=Brachypodium distachyon TaxID=15368 RepID=A0A2K2CTQ7_BRADI|nr:hypothetical protein BRADI_4g42112v3 [Brachypodium distachyon]PNT65416.1 hypothetical protein BRADI_4g42112v3 [Brachypodium distachyon]